MAADEEPRREPLRELLVCIARRLLLAPPLALPLPLVGQLGQLG